MNFSFEAQVGIDRFNKTKAVWTEQIRENPESTSESYYMAHLEHLEKIIDGTTVMADGNGCVCAVVQEGHEHAAALITVSHAQGRDSLKMLDVSVQPKLNLADSEPNVFELAWIAAELIVGCLNLTYRDFPSSELRIYTTFPLDHEFLTAVTTVMFKDPELGASFEVQGQGRWLVVRKKQPPRE